MFIVLICKSIGLIRIGFGNNLVIDYSMRIVIKFALIDKLLKALSI